MGVSEGDQARKDPGKGFAGLSSMVSDVDGTLVPPTQKPQASEQSSPPGPAPTDPDSSQRPYQAPPQPTSGSGVGKWLLGIGAVVGVLWLAAQSGDKTSVPAPAYTPSEPPRTFTTPSPNWQPPVSPPQPPSRPLEDRPPVGTGIVLSNSQIRYCLAEDIRMTAAKSVISGYNEADVDRFNGMVADYNSRCSSFKYRRGSLESVRAEVESVRADLEAEGRGRFRQDSPKRRSKVGAAVKALRDSVASALATKDGDVPRLQFSDEESQSRYEQWQTKTSPHLTAIKDQAIRQEFLRVVWYESVRAGLEPNLVLGLVQVASAYRKYAISESGARGYMQVAPNWAIELGDGDPAKLFQMQVNLRFGCVLLRHFQDTEGGDIQAALRAYHEQAEGRLAGLPKASPALFAQMVLKVRSNWATRVGAGDDPSEKGDLPMTRGALQPPAKTDAAERADAAAPQEGRKGNLQDQDVARPLEAPSPGPTPSGTVAARAGPTDPTASEQAAIERACETTRRVSGDAAYNTCLAREVSSLKSSGGRPDLSMASEAERSAIERACETTQRISGPGAYYGCLVRERSALRSSGGRPDLSHASDAERVAIERACETTQRISGPGAYYECLRREVSSLRASGGRPDLSMASESERMAIERACETTQRISGPGSHYACLSRELAGLRSSGGPPDLSRLSSGQQASIERACETIQRISGPGAYYGCLRRELALASSR
jgi:hypothetical protein